MKRRKDKKMKKRSDGIFHDGRAKKDNDREFGYAVTFAAASNKPVEGMLAPMGIFVCCPFGIWYNRYTPELTFDEINPKDYAAIVIAGGLRKISISLQ